MPRHLPHSPGDAGARSRWADHARAIGITLVVIGHVLRGLVQSGILPPSPAVLLLDSVIYSFHMPLLFFVSGLLFAGSLARHGRGGTFRGKLERLIPPYLVWSLLQGSIEVMLAGATNNRTGWAEVLALLWQPRAQFWFLYALALVMLLALLLYRDAAARRSLAPPLLGLALYLAAPWLPDNLYLDYLAGYFVFFAFGVWAEQALPRLAARAWPLTLWGLAVAALLQVYVQLLLQAGDAGPGPARLSLAATAILATLALSMLLGRRRHPWAEAVGRASMPIFLMHILAASGLRVVLQRGLGLDDPALHGVLGIAAGLAAPMLAASLWARHLAPALPVWTARLGWRLAADRG
ncbi:hypothetical protein BKE38_00760 [Pseudoroseomonas deserti]|uniref:Acyltransferase 3 domain-containing protein n=1 Tax=Teichococcus deserti TaxID=1817963 RepID=A0A1V2H9F2_9PROT|nr:acyltransferase [Pseudoroseomonas deserti]ONG59002.1 hypothetical protein BKE38_00760 [Pseudoroseomonas deserti]